MFYYSEQLRWQMRYRPAVLTQPARRAGVSTAEPPLDVAVSVAAKSSARVGNQISSMGSGELRRRSGCDVSAGECDAGDGDGYEAVDRQRDKGSAG